MSKTEISEIRSSERYFLSPVAECAKSEFINVNRECRSRGIKLLLSERFDVIFHQGPGLICSLTLISTSGIKI